MENKKIILFKKVNDIEKSNFYEYLAVMIDGWVSISSALETMQNRTKNVFFQEKIKELIEFIASWDPLSKAMKKIPDVFKDSENAIIEAWENAGSLQDSLYSLSTNLKNRYNLKNTVKGALTYPLIIIVFLVLSVVITMTYVIPSLIPVFADSGVELPQSTKMLIATSDFISDNLSLIFVILISIALFITGYKNTESGRVMFHSMYLKFPLVSELYRNYIIANVASNFGSLIGGWIPITKTISLTGRATSNAIYEQAFEDVNEDVKSGKKVVESMLNRNEKMELFPADFIQMLSVWEKTATIDKVCVKINEQYTREVKTSLNNLTKWIEPLAILLAWIFVLWFAFAIFGAILSITDSVQ